jgi:hypothetical protein
MTFYGARINVPVRSLVSILVLEPTLGLDTSQPSVDAPLGSTPSASNMILREGGIEPRSGLQLRNTNPQPINGPVLGGQEVWDVGGVRYPIVSGRTQVAWFSNGSWSLLSYVSAGGVDASPNGSTTSYWDGTQIYYANRDQNIAVLANGSYQSLYCWESNTTVYSTLTGAPRAKYVASFDNYILAFNIRDPGSATSDFVQRVQWNDRGSASSWTGGLSGFEDLLTMKGEGTRIVAQDNLVILFSTNEIWQGYPSNFPFVFRFEPYDRSVGCPYPWTVADTPLGLIFLSRNLQTYLLPKAGGPAQPIGQRIHRTIRDSIDAADRSWGIYDYSTNHYQLYIPTQGGSGYPQSAVFLNLDEGSWAPQTYDTSLSLTRGFAITGLAQTSSATSWDGALGITWDGTNKTWDSFNTTTVVADRRDVYVGSSAGTVYVYDSNATTDNGVAIPCRWRSTALWGDMPGRQKTVTEWRVDYQSESASSLTLKFSQNQGGSFEQGTGVDLPATSGASQAIAYPYLSAGYPCFQVESEGQRYRLFRFYIQARIGGR